MTQNQKPYVIKPAEGKLGIMLVGLGAISTTFIAGIDAIRSGRTKPYGSLTQMGTIRLGKRTEYNIPKVCNFLPLAKLEDIEIAAWDIFEDDAYVAAKKAGVLDYQDLEAARPALEKIVPLRGVFDREWVKKLDGKYIKNGRTKMDLANQVMEDIKTFQKNSGCSRVVMVWCASTEVFTPIEEVHKSVKNFEKGLESNDPKIAPSMIYAYAAIKLGIPFANGAPNLSVDTPALQELANEYRAPICGKDFKTGQTLMKTILAPGLRSRLLGLSGWFSTNILGNRDGEVLDDPGSFKTKEESKLSVLDTILQPEINPDLYGNVHHKVRINYYPPRGDAKEGWDNIDIFGWMGYPMQIKVDFLCRDSILAAPLVLDLALFIDLAKRAELRGIQEWLSFYFKSPMVGEGLYPEHNLFIQEMKLKNTLRHLMGEEPITHLGTEYYNI
ncbi:MAG: Myo-inositol-1-phosphate synthase [bacterium ADurb.Bin270]|nr:MAG: Myo-inositol-1-phosphate synthase [bacterium ADurb.Bin270]HQG13250.1 inositol-3-phosphate synthase [bacterium]HQH81214.1 inositol-3-phosphate synthase [bacterium]